MKLITKDTDYAFRALCVLAAHKGEVITVKELVDDTNVPRPFLRKILQILAKNDIVCSTKGKGGGFCLKKSPEKIYIVDIIEIFQGDIAIHEHRFRDKKCKRIKKCKLKKVFDEIEKYMSSRLSSVTLASLL